LQQSLRSDVEIFQILRSDHVLYRRIDAGVIAFLLVLLLRIKLSYLVFEPSAEDGDEFLQVFVVNGQQVD